MDAVGWIVNGTAIFMGALGLIAIYVAVELFNEYRNRNNKSNRDQSDQPRARV